MRIIAIDPGYERLGVAILERLKGQKESLIFSSCIRTSKTLTHEKRLLLISNSIIRIIKEFNPRAMAIETLFLTKNQKTVMFVAEARGALLTDAARLGLSVKEYTPLQIKIALTGYGRSDKQQVSAMVKKLIVIPPQKRLDDEYDAIATGLTYFACEREK